MKKVILVGLLGLIIFSLYILSHETTHKQIYNYFGCENISFGLNKLEPYTTADCGNIPDYHYSNLQLAHSNTDSLGYLFIPFLTIYTLYLLLNNEIW